MNNLVLLSYNTKTYTLNKLHVLVINFAVYYGYKLIVIIYNEAQNSKTELYLSFYHFKLQFYKYFQFTKSLILSPKDIAKSIRYNGSIKISNWTL